MIEEKGVTTGQFLDDGNLGANPLASADGLCEPGSRALFAVPGLRVATTEPFDVVDPLDWVLEPYTAYVNVDGELIWLTDATALLGVRDGVQQDLLAAITDETSQNFFDYQIITGLNADWTSSNSNTCNGWASGSAGQTARFGSPSMALMPDVINDFSGPCSEWSQSTTTFPFINFDSTTVYCVEQ